MGIFLAESHLAICHPRICHNHWIIGYVQYHYAEEEAVREGRWFCEFKLYRTED
jgi:hypothetical protein